MFGNKQCDSEPVTPATRYAEMTGAELRDKIYNAPSNIYEVNLAALRDAIRAEALEDKMEALGDALFSCDKQIAELRTRAERAERVTDDVMVAVERYGILMHEMGHGPTSDAALYSVHSALTAALVPAERVPAPTDDEAELRLERSAAEVNAEWMAVEEARLRKRHENSGTNRPYYSGD